MEDEQTRDRVDVSSCDEVCGDVIKYGDSQGRAGERATTEDRRTSRGSLKMDVKPNKEKRGQAIYFLPPLGVSLPPCSTGVGASRLGPLPPLSPLCPFGPLWPFGPLPPLPPFFPLFAMSA